MNFLWAIRDIAARAWLAAAPLVLLVLLPLGVFICLFVAEKIVAVAWGPEAAESFVANAMMLLGAAFLLMLAAGLLYGLFSVARWLLRSNKP